MHQTYVMLIVPLSYPVLRFSDFDSFCRIGFHELHQGHQAAFTETLGAAEVSKNTNINSLKPRYA